MSKLRDRARDLLKALYGEWPEVSLSPSDAEPHWACPSCGQPCRCQGTLRREPHVPCGVEER